MIDFINRAKREMFSILKDLCSLSAPSHSEQNRAKYCKEYLENIGAKGVYIDDALNVIYPYNCSSCDDITAYLDLKGLGAGTHEVPVMVEGKDSKVEYKAKTKKVSIKIIK